jgi:hypothetical protein
MVWLPVLFHQPPSVCLWHPPAVQGSDQIRQAFSKRKKGLVLKAYQLNALTDAKVGSLCAGSSSSKLAGTCMQSTSSCALQDASHL